MLKFTVALLLIYWLAQSQQVDFSGIGSGLLTPGQLMVALALMSGLVMQIVRWFMLMGLQGVQITLGQAARIFWIGQLFFVTSLGVAGGEAARGYYISRYAGERSLAAVSTVFMDRALGLYTLTILGSVAYAALAWQGEPPGAVAYMGLAALFLFAAITLFFLALSNKRITGFLLELLPLTWRQRLQVHFADTDFRLRAMLPALIASMLSNVAIVVAFKLAADLLQTPIGWSDIFLITPLVAIANSLPISFGGLGVGEAAAQALMAQVGLGNGAAVMLLVRVSLWITVLPFGAYYYTVEGGKMADAGFDGEKNRQN